MPLVQVFIFCSFLLSPYFLVYVDIFSFLWLHFQKKKEKEKKIQTTFAVSSFFCFVLFSKKKKKKTLIL